MDRKKHGCLYLIAVPLCIIAGIYVIVNLVNGRFAKFDIKKAENNAIGYIEDKYGFTPEIKKVNTYDRRENELAPSSDMPNDPKHAVFIMSDGSREFRVETGGTKEDNTGKDNYQSEEIIQALTDKINSAVPGGMLKSIYFGERDGLRECMFDKSGYYDGNDIMNVMNCNDIKIIMCYYDAEFDDCDLFRELSDTRTNVYLVSFNSREIMEKCAMKGNYSGSENTFYYYEYDMDDIIRNAPYIKDMWNAGCQGNERRAFELHDEGEFLYYCPELASGESLTVTETDAKKVYEANKKYLDGIGEKHVTESYKEPVFRIVTKGYELKTDKDIEKVYVYFRRSAVDAGDNHIIQATVSGPVSDSYHFSDYAVGDYQAALFDLSGKEVSFCFIDTKKIVNS